MYKPLTEDSTAEAANIAIEQWRDSGKTDFEESLLSMSEVPKHIIKSQHYRELVASLVLETITGKKDTISNVMVNVSLGVMVGFKYAMYLHEQRELKEVK